MSTDSKAAMRTKSKATPSQSLSSPKAETGDEAVGVDVDTVSLEPPSTVKIIDDESMEQPLLESGATGAASAAPRVRADAGGGPGWRPPHRPQPRQLPDL